MPAILPRERRPKVRLSLPPSLEPAKESESSTNTPGGGPLEGGGGLEFIRHDYCYISGHQCLCRVAHSVLEHRLGARSVATFITKRAALLRSQRPGSLLLWSAAMEGTVGRRGCKPWVAIGGELRAMLNMDFAECGKDEVRRIPLPGTWVNKARDRAEAALDPGPCD